MSGTLERPYGYKGDFMNLPSADVEAALPFYETVLGFLVVSRDSAPHKSAVLARDRIQMQIVENGPLFFAGWRRVPYDRSRISVCRGQGQMGWRSSRSAALSDTGISNGRCSTPWRPMVSATGSASPSARRQGHEVL